MNIKDQIRAEIGLAKAPAKIYIPVIKDIYGDHLEIEARWQREANDAFDFNIEYIRKDLIDTLPESAKRGYKDCNGCEYNRIVKDQIGWQFRGCFGGEYKGKPIAEIELCPLKVDSLPEQPAEGLDEEIERFCEDMWNSLPNFNYSDGKAVIAVVEKAARHFAEWGAEHLKKLI